MIEENDEFYDPLLDDIVMATLMEDVDSESGSQTGLRGVDEEDPAHEKEGTMVIPGKAHSSGCSYYKQTVSITTATVKVFLSCYSNIYVS